MLEKPVGTEFNALQPNGLAPSQRLHIILLGVEDVKKSARFYELLGWKRSPAGNDGFVKFDMGGYALCLISREDFAKDARYETSEGNGFSGVVFIYLAKNPEEVPRILAKAVASGGTLVKPATRTHWGVAGYFKDLDGHLFEVDYEDTWVFSEGHRLVVDEVNQ
ncbi:hypothetical protein SAMN02745866_04073 [Alteromonadaceae bacterium Bs31]|nr:hypothetical protein SAMN02745866_04073 [Alteromonadaceae bacterium Bs31]